MIIIKKHLKIIYHQSLTKKRMTSYVDEVHITQDGGIVKKMIRAGEEGRKPEQGQEVVVKYEGRLEDGTIFDSSHRFDYHTKLSRCGFSAAVVLHGSRPHRHCRGLLRIFPSNRPRHNSGCMTESDRFRLCMGPSGSTSPCAQHDGRDPTGF